MAAGRLSTIRRRVIDGAARRTGLTRPLMALRHRLFARRVQTSDAPAADGYPLPPPELLVGITGEAKSHSWYEESGEGDLEAIVALLRRHGIEAQALEAVLDFGCGCGRVARRWRRFPGIRVCGSDYDPAMVSWCRKNLPFLDARRNDAAPPLAFESRGFDLAYAFSVFTHLEESAHRPWLAELRRVLKPGGMLLFSALGQRVARGALNPQELDALDRDGILIRHPEVSGEALCTAYQAPAWTEASLAEAGFELVERFDEDDPFRGVHDFYLARAI